jgi:ketosteroid isomerase-like protein
MSTETTRALIDDFYGALQTGDKARLLEILAPDAVWIPPAAAPIERTEGAEAIVAALGGNIVREMFDISKPFALEVRRTVVDRGVARGEPRRKGTAKANASALGNP